MVVGGYGGKWLASKLKVALNKKAVRADTASDGIILEKGKETR